MYNTIQDLNDRTRVTGFITDEDGYLVNPYAWSPLFAEKTLGVEPGSLDYERLRVIYFIRDKFLRLGALPPMRTVCKSSGLDKAELKQTFGSCLQLWKAAGLPAPDDELRAYMN